MARPPGKKREPILEGALEAFVDSGFYGATIPRIAKHAGVSPATCYLYFESKEALANTLFRECLTRVYEYVAPGMNAEVPEHASFMAMWRGLLHFGRERIREYLFLSRAVYSDYLDDESRTMLQSYNEGEMKWLNRCREAGIVGDISLFEVWAVVRGHARVLVEMAAAGNLLLNDELIERAGAMNWAALAASKD